MTHSTCAERLRRLFELAGVDATYGVADDWDAIVDVVVAPGVAAPLAAAHRRVHGAAAAVHLGEGRFVLGDVYASDPVVIEVESARDTDDLEPHLLEVLGTIPTPRVELHVRVAPETSTAEVVPGSPPPSAASWVEPDAALVERVRAARQPMMIAGPGVPAAGAVADLHALATSADLGVLNTWGAKGIFDWRSRHHWATVGLQARDLDLGGVPESDLVVLTGVDPDELDLDALADVPTVVVPPNGLGPLAERWSRPRSDRAMPELRTRLAAVTQEGWASTSAPLPPSQATRDYAAVLGGDGFVAADPGVAGYWLARTFGTTRIGGAQVPARRAERGSAIASVLVARLRHPRARALAVTDAPLGELDEELLATAQRLGIPVQVEVWDPAGPTLDANAHSARLTEMAMAGTTVQSLATDQTQLDAMIEAAGAVTAWDGLVGDLAAIGQGGLAEHLAGPPRARRRSLRRYRTVVRGRGAAAGRVGRRGGATRRPARRARGRGRWGRGVGR